MASEVICFFFKTYFTGQADCWKTLECTIDTFTTGKSIYHFRNEKRTGNEMRPAIVSGIVTGDAPVSYCSIFSLFLVIDPEAFAKVNSAQFPTFGESCTSLFLIREHDGDVNENGKKSSRVRLAKH